MLTSASPGRGGGDGVGAAASYRVRSTRPNSADLSEPLLQLGMAPALMVGWIEGGAGFFLFSVLPGGAVELPGRSRPAPGVVDLRGVAQCRALSPDFPAGARGLYPLAKG